MSWVEGVRLSDLPGVRRYGLSPARLVDTLVQCTLRQMLGHGFFHADPHGGNILVTPDGTLRLTLTLTLTLALTLTSSSPQMARSSTSNAPTPRPRPRPLLSP